MSNTEKTSNNPNTSKTSKAARLKHVVRLARRGEAIPEEIAPGRLLRAAHNVVAVVSGNLTQNQMKRNDEEYNSARMAQFEMTADAARGLNAEVMAILREAAEMPGQTVTHPIGLGHSKPGNYKQGKPNQIGGVHYGRTFSMNGYDNTKPFGGSVPLVSASGRPPAITVDSRSSAMNPLNVRINTLSIWYEAPAVIEGERYGTYVSEVRPGYTTIRINDSEPPEPRYDRMYVKRPGMPAEINRDSTPDGEVMIRINDQGVVDRVAVGRMNSVSPVELKDPVVDVAGLLGSLRNDIYATNHANVPPDSPAALLPYQQ